MTDLFLPTDFANDDSVQVLQELIEHEASKTLPLQQTRVGHYFVKGEPPPNGCVEHPDASIGGVHGPNDVDVGWNHKRLTTLRQDYRHASFVGFENGDQFAKNSGEIPSIHLVNENDEPSIRQGQRRSADAFEYTILQFEIQPAAR
jgi:hypothetical protein